MPENLAYQLTADDALGKLRAQRVDHLLTKHLHRSPWCQIGSYGQTSSSWVVVSGSSALGSL